MTVREAVVALNALGEKYRDVEITFETRYNSYDIGEIKTGQQQTGKNTYRDAVFLMEEDS